MARLRWTFAIPVLAAGAAGGFIGWAVARVGCLDGSCSPAAVFVIGLVSGLVAAVGVGIVVVLADRSLREWREWPGRAESRNEKGAEPEGGEGGDERTP